MVKFDCYETKHKYPRGAVRCLSPVRFTVHAASSLCIHHINMILRGGGEIHSFVLNKIKTDGDYGVFSGDIQITSPGFHKYRFELVRDDGIMYFAGTKDGHSAVLGDWLAEWNIYAYESDFETPSDMGGAIMYQIFPDRFFRAEGGGVLAAKNERIMHESWDENPLCWYDCPGFRCNDFFGGNLLGIEQKLGYLKSLGVTHIYLNPIFESAENHRYSTSNYMNIDPFLGDEAHFISLCSRAAEYDIKIILDGVFSHTGDDSIYFNKYNHYDSTGAYNSKESPYYSWYNFTEYPDSYDCWWGFKTLPNVRETNPDYLEFITGSHGVLRHWMRLGASGWRLDVADELPDEFLDSVRRAVKEQNPDGLIIGEVWENAVTKHSYGALRRFLRGSQCDTVMNYPFSNAIEQFLKTADAEAFYLSVMEILNDYPAPAVRCLMNMLSTHDTARIINRLALTSMPPRSEQSGAVLSEKEKSAGIELMMCAVVLQYTLPGVPCVYYGDEAGLDGFEDPFCRKTYPWGKEKKQLLNLHKELGIIRSENSNDFLSDIEFVRFSGGVVHFTRKDIHVIVNMSEKSVPFEGLEPLSGYKYDEGFVLSGGAAALRRKVNGKDTFNL